jgi:membrane fusion protein (multidrug efflux system)
MARQDTTHSAGGGGSSGLAIEVRPQADALKADTRSEKHAAPVSAEAAAPVAEAGKTAPSETPPSPPHGATPASKAKRPARRGPLILAVLAILGGGFGIMKGVDYWKVGRFMVSTDDAYVTVDITQLAGKVSGHVAAVNVKANQAVKTGDVLFTLDQGDFKLALAAAEAKLVSQDATIRRIGDQITAAGAQYDSAIAQREANAADLALAEASLARLSSLEQSAVSSKAALDAAARDRRKAAAGVSGAEAQIAAAKANVAVLQAQQEEAQNVRAELEIARQQAIRNLGFTEIRAPVNGVVGNLAIQVGNYVQPGQRLASLVPLGEVHIDANFKETQLEHLKPGQEVSVKVDAYPDLDIKGHLDSFSPATGSVFSLLPAQNATGNFTKVVQRVPVRVILPADVLAAGKLYPGLSVVVDADTRTH